MRDHPIDTPNTNSRNPSTASLSISRKVSPDLLAFSQPYSEMSLAMLAAHCIRELNRYSKDEPFTESYNAELVCRATINGDQEARTCMQQVFGRLVLDWIHHHPLSAEACCLKNEEYYMTQAFERFWQAPASHQHTGYSTLAGILHSLHLCLHGAILDILRASNRIWDTPFQEPTEPSMKDATSSSELWELCQSLLEDKRELRLAYLLFHCGLKPREIVLSCQQEWSDLDEIYRLRHMILLRLHNQVAPYIQKTHNGQ